MKLSIILALTLSISLFASEEFLNTPFGKISKKDFQIIEKFPELKEWSINNFDLKKNAKKGASFERKVEEALKVTKRQMYLGTQEITTFKKFKHIRDLIDPNQESRIQTFVLWKSIIDKIKVEDIYGESSPEKEIVIMLKGIHSEKKSIHNKIYQFYNVTLIAYKKEYKKDIQKIYKKIIEYQLDWNEFIPLTEKTLEDLLLSIRELCSFRNKQINLMNRQIDLVDKIELKLNKKLARDAEERARIEREELKKFIKLKKGEVKEFKALKSLFIIFLLSILLARENPKNIT